MKTKIKFAYADDHEAVRKGIISLLNCDTIECIIDEENGRKLIDAIAKAKDLPDVCLLDVNMPVLNGYDTLIEIKKRWPSMKVLVLTAFDAELLIIRMIMNGANGYILKNAGIAELQTAIHTVSRSSMYYSEVASQHLVLAIKNKEVFVQNLTERELLVMKKSCTDLTYAQIAEEMRVTTRSVEGYRDSIFRKLHINSRVSLALFAVQLGLVTLEVASFHNENFLIRHSDDNHAIFERPL
ncbi:MAG: response regulator transcription factor [Flavipsychrobacter sp.]|nr:response regulator transcription factor [Flavipsychrobacter sp.]